MTTITREQLHERARRKVKELEFAITQSAFTSIRDGLNEELELARIALASLDAEPVGEVIEQQSGMMMDGLVISEKPTYRNIKGIHKMKVMPLGTKFYTAPPAPVSVSDELLSAMEEVLRISDRDHEAWHKAKAGILSCRVAMLQGSQPVSNRDELPPSIKPAPELDSVAKNAKSLPSKSPVTPDCWISCSERMPIIGELNWRTSFPLLITCEIGVIPAYYGFVRVNGNKHYGFMESLKYGDDSGNHPQTNEYGMISNVTH
ncbi:DUF551 domain-containing protein [Salmonella enterica]|uniref:DUF551 domain-containing protein n=1 Tax=Salmonella enterica TaxID=28901 RepID=UPI00406BFAED